MVNEVVGASSMIGRLTDESIQPEILEGTWESESRIQAVQYIERWCSYGTDSEFLMFEAMILDENITSSPLRYKLAPRPRSRVCHLGISGRYCEIIRK